jgi:hypothetical protein
VARLVTVTWWHAALQLQPSSCNFKLIQVEVTGLSVQEARNGRCMSAWVVCRTSEDPEESHWPGQTSESIMITTTVCQWP